MWKTQPDKYHSLLYHRRRKSEENTEKNDNINKTQIYMSSLPNARTESGRHEDPVGGHESCHDPKQGIHKQRRQ